MAEAEGSFTRINNEYKRTPLQRIQKEIDDVNRDIRRSETELQYTRSADERRFIMDKIRDLKKTVELLNEEASDRRERVIYLKERRRNCMHELACLRQQQQRHANRIEKLFRKIHKIDKDLGPFRYNDETFGLG